MKAIVIVDMQNDFVTGSLGSIEAQAVVTKMINKLKEYEAEQPLVLFTKDTHYENYFNTQEGKYLPVEHCVINTKGWSIVKEISTLVDNGNFPTISSPSIIKGRILKETFGSTDLAYLFLPGGIAGQLEIDEVILMGVCTDICVVSNALLIKAHNPELKISVEASCCAGTTPEAHNAALQTMKSCQINIIGE